MPRGADQAAYAHTHVFGCLNMRGASIDSFSKRKCGDEPSSSSQSSKRQVRDADNRTDNFSALGLDLTDDEAACFKFLQRVMIGTPELQAFKPLDNKKQHTDCVIREKHGPKKGVMVYKGLLAEGVDMAKLVFHVPLEPALKVFLHM
jgi:hypothetical protein